MYGLPISVWLGLEKIDQPAGAMYDTDNLDPVRNLAVKNEVASHWKITQPQGDV